MMKRIQFLKSSLIASSFFMLPKVNWGQSAKEEHISLAEIKEFVFAAHKDFEKTKSMVEKNPLLLNCTNQAKRGDFETALGGASHMGRTDIAQMLVAKGARMDLFNLTFLGYTDLVKSILKDNPQYLTAPGPHGFSLLHHANVGQQTEFGYWLKEQGLETLRFEDAF